MYLEEQVSSFQVKVKVKVKVKVDEVGSLCLAFLCLTCALISKSNFLLVFREVSNLERTERSKRRE